MIFVARGTVHGLTTAASLWMTSAIGMAAGAGFMRIALVGLLAAVFVVTVLWLVERLCRASGRAGATLTPRTLRRLDPADVRATTEGPFRAEGAASPAVAGLFEEPGAFGQLAASMTPLR